MKNEDAIKYLIIPVATSTKSYNEYLKQKEAYDLAIKALLEKTQVTVFAENASKEEIEDFKQELENVLEKTQGEWLSHYDYGEKHGYNPFASIAFWWCNQCGQAVEHPTNFCPNCGARMKKEFSE